MRLLRIALLSILLTVVGGAPASAGPGLPSMDQYRWLSCADSTGEIISLRRGSYAEEYELTHTIAPCTHPSPTSAYAIAFYHSDGTARGIPLPMPPTPLTSMTEGLSIAPNAVAVCLITRPDYRIACSGVVVQPTGEATLGPPIPVDSPPVAVWARVPMSMVGVDPPVCPSCW